MQVTRQVISPETDRAHQLLVCGMLLVEDDCPPEREAYLCARQEDFDEEVCARCWRTYLLAVSNGKASPTMRREVHPP